MMDIRNFPNAQCAKCMLFKRRWDKHSQVCGRLTLQLLAVIKSFALSWLKVEPMILQLTLVGIIGLPGQQHANQPNNPTIQLWPLWCLNGRVWDLHVDLTLQCTGSRHNHCFDMMCLELQFIGHSAFSVSLHIKDPVVYVWVRWIIKTLKNHISMKLVA